MGREDLEPITSNDYSIANVTNTPVVSGKFPSKHSTISEIASIYKLTYTGTYVYIDGNKFEIVTTDQPIASSISNEKSLYKTKDGQYYANAGDRTFKIVNPSGNKTIKTFTPKYGSTTTFYKKVGSDYFLTVFEEIGQSISLVEMVTLSNLTPLVVYKNKSFAPEFTLKVIVVTIDFTTIIAEYVYDDEYTTKNKLDKFISNVNRKDYTNNIDLLNQFKNGYVTEENGEYTVELYGDFQNVQTSFTFSVETLKEIDSIDISLNDGRKVLLGLTPNELKKLGYFKITGSYTTGDEEITDYTIENGDEILYSNSTLVFNINTNDYYGNTSKQTLSSYEYEIPSVDKIDISNSPNSASTTNPIVDLSNVLIKVYYKNIDSWYQELDVTGVSDKEHAKAQFIGSDEGNISTYSFDGTTPLEAPFDNEIQYNLQIKYTFKNIFNDEELTKSTDFVFKGVQRLVKLEVTQLSNIIKGNNLNNHKEWFAVKATYNSGIVDEDYKEYTISPNTIDKEEIKTITFHRENTDVKVDLNNPTYANPTIKEKKFYNFTRSKTNKGTITLDNAYIEVYYEDSPNVKVLKYSDNQFTASLNTPFDKYVFGTLLETDFENESKIDSNYILKWKDYYSGIEIVDTSVAFTLFEISDIIGITILKEGLKTDYEVGDYFLENDDTQVTIRYKDITGNVQKMTIPLNTGLDTLNISPAIGTELKTYDLNKVVTVSSASDSSVQANYFISVNAKNVKTTTETLKLVARYDKTDEKYYLYKETDDKVQANRQGYLENVGDKSTNAVVCLYNDYLAPVEGQSNIEVQFPCYVEGNADKINHCTFGVLFGNNNAKNRLFVSGNSDISNCDWHTGETMVEQIDDNNSQSGNFSYFEDTSYCYYGETDNKVVAYSIISNNKLLALKDKSDKETTVYFRSPTLVTAIDGGGNAVQGIDNQTLYQEEFSLVKGNNSVGGINHRNIVNFNGDTLFLSEDKQILGLDLEGIVGDNQRYANTRSYFIDKHLKEEDFEGSFMWTNNKYLFLVLKQRIYVTHIEAKVDNQYEWWVMNIDGVTSIIEIDNQIYMAREGRLCKFREDYQDVRAYYLNEGTSMIKIVGEDTDTLSTEVALNQSVMQTFDFENKSYTMEITNSTPMFYSIGKKSSENNSVVTEENTDSNYIHFTADSKDLIALFSSSKAPKLCFLYKDSEGNVIKVNNQDYVPVKLSDEIKYDCFKFAKTNDKYSYLDVSALKGLTEYDICLELTGEHKVGFVDFANSTFKLLDDNGDVIDIVYGINQSSTTRFKAIIREYQNVKAYFVSRPFDFGNLNYFKTILSWTIANDTNIPSETEVAYVTNKIPLDNMKTMARIGAETEDFNLSFFNFNKIDFTKNYVPRTYTSNRILAQKKYIVFGFRNNNNTNSVLGKLSIIYILPTIGYGGD